MWYALALIRLYGTPIFAYWDSCHWGGCWHAFSLSIVVIFMPSSLALCFSRSCPWKWTKIKICEIESAKKLETFSNHRRHGLILVYRCVVVVTNVGRLPINITCKCQKIRRKTGERRENVCGKLNGRYAH